MTIEDRLRELGLRLPAPVVLDAAVEGDQIRFELREAQPGGG